MKVIGKLQYRRKNTQDPWSDVWSAEQMNLLNRYPHLIETRAVYNKPNQIKFGALWYWLGRFLKPRP